MEPNMISATPTFKFEVRCNAGNDGQFHVKTRSLSVRLGGQVRRNGTAEFWDSVIVLCEETQLGMLSTKVIVCHPDWDQHLQIAHIQSRTTEPDSSIPALEFDLKPVQI